MLFSLSLIFLCSCNGEFLSLYSVPEVGYQRDPSLTLDENPKKKEETSKEEVGKGGEIWKEDEGQRGLVGKVYDISDLTNSERRCASLLGNIKLNQRNAEDATIAIPNLDIPTRGFADGFPGRSDLNEWFAVRFEGVLKISEAGNYQLGLNADDGAVVYLNDELVVNNDGVHSPRLKSSRVLDLGQGTHRIRIEYFQGPRYHIALQLLMRKGNTGNFAAVPPEMLDRP